MFLHDEILLGMKNAGFAELLGVVKLPLVQQNGILEEGFLQQLLLELVLVREKSF